MACDPNAKPTAADWYYCAIVNDGDSTDYVDGYAMGDRPELEDVFSRQDIARVLEWATSPTPHGTYWMEEKETTEFP